MGWQERGAFEVVPLQSPWRSAAGGVSLISPPLALSAQVEELDPAGGERKKGGKTGVRDEREGGRKRGSAEEKNTPITLPFLFFHFLYSCSTCSYLNLFSDWIDEPKEVFKLCLASCFSH